MKKILLATCLGIATLTGCVSAKKYKLLEADYQKAGEAQRGYEQDHRILLVEVQDMKQRVARLETENKEIDSVNHTLRHRIMLENTEGNWQEKYETLLKEYEKVAPEGKTRGTEEANGSPANYTDRRITKFSPPIKKSEKVYANLEKAKEVKLPEKQATEKKEPNEPEKKDVAIAEKKEPNEPEKKDVAIAEKKEPAQNENKGFAITEEKKEIAKTENIDQQERVTKLNTQIQQVLNGYQLGENVKQDHHPFQITIAFSDDILFEGEEASKLSVKGEELLNKLMYTFSQYPNLTIDLISQGMQSEAKTKRISEMFSHFNIKTRIVSKNSVPLAFETSGTQKAVSLLTLRVD